LTPELVGPLLRDEQIRGRLLEYLPEEHRETQDLEELIRTPQFRSQLETFSQALQSGEMDMAQFGLKQNGVASLETFLKAIQAEVDESSGKNEEEDAMES
jgi:6-phosphogluconate dehydrogenase